MKTLFALTLLMLTACVTDAAEVDHAVRNLGMTDVQVGDTVLFACSRDDMIGRGFTAKNVTGARVSGVVCCGQLFKGCTVRF